MGNSPSGTTIEIADADGFPAKVTRIREAAAGLSAIAGELGTIADTARTETMQFTRDGVPAPIYAQTLEGLDAWAKAAAALTRSVADQAQAAADTISEKFTAITGTDIAAAADIHHT
ncbi:hypothetical protein [Mycolicibacterium austroafricanum]|uniref:hypothetical protein n=1 Tax=Mycolicibacterium austroafricanum TaxID=39687 RepID=UPI000686F87E|nr:hypothetical protein [Mycolicibacterium austroafricanum]